MEGQADHWLHSLHGCEAAQDFGFYEFLREIQYCFKYDKLQRKAEVY